MKIPFNEFFAFLSYGIWGLLIRSIVACVIILIYYLIRTALFGETNEISIYESLFLLFGSVFLAIFISNKFSRR